MYMTCRSSVSTPAGTYMYMLVCWYIHVHVHLYSCFYSLFSQKTINSKTTLWVSVDRKSFNQAKIPRDNHLTYFVASIRSLQALVVIRHTDNIYNLYMSEEQGVLYYQALSDIQVDHPLGGGYFIDLELVSSSLHFYSLTNVLLYLEL